MDDKKSDFIESSKFETKISGNVDLNLDSIKEVYKIDEVDMSTTKENVKTLETNMNSTEIFNGDNVTNITPEPTHIPKEVDKNKPWRKYIRRKIGDG